MKNSCTPQKNRVATYLPNPLAEVDSLFNHFLGQNVRQVGWNAPAAIWEAEDRLHVEVDLPGVALEDTSVTFDKGVLTITAERRAAEDQRKFWHNERAVGQVTRTVSLPDTVDPESIAAEFERGVLHITIAKLPQAQPRRIEIKST
jgi:HSP20 family protein